jgi:hypothetical protein
MRRLALLLAAFASVLGMGCVGTTTVPTGSVDLYWDFVRTAPAQPGGFIVYDKSLGAARSGPCTESGVETVRVIPPGGQPIDVACVNSNGSQGITIDGVYAGNQTFRVIGYRTINGASTAVYDSNVTVPVVGGQANTFTADVAGVPGALDIFAYLDYSSGAYTNCYDAYNPGFTFEVKDVFGTLITNGTGTCPGTAPLPVLVSPGTLELDDYKVRLQGLDSTKGSVVFDSCWVPLQHFGDQTTTSGFAPTLTTPPPSCTPFP